MLNTRSRYSEMAIGFSSDVPIAFGKISRSSIRNGGAVPEYYRYQESNYTGGVVMLTLSVFPVLKETPAGVWLDVYGCKKFVLKTARKRYACPTIEEALASYQARKKRQIKILRAQLSRAEVAATLTVTGQIGSHLTNALR